MFFVLVLPFLYLSFLADVIPSCSIPSSMPACCLGCACMVCVYHITCLLACLHTQTCEIKSLYHTPAWILSLPIHNRDWYLFALLCHLYGKCMLECRNIVCTNGLLMKGRFKLRTCLLSKSSVIGILGKLLCNHLSKNTTSLI